MRYSVILSILCSVLFSGTSFGSVIEITTIDQFYREVVQNSKPVVIKCYMPRCLPCRQMIPFFNAVARSLANQVVFFNLNCDMYALRSLVQQYSIQAVPTILCFNKGNLIARGSFMSELSLSNFIRQAFQLS